MSRGDRAEPARREGERSTAGPILTRRQLLGGLLGGTVASLLRLPESWAIGPSSVFQVARLQLGTAPLSRPGAERRLVWEILKRTSIAGSLDELVLPPESVAIFDHPFLCWAGEDSFGPLSATARNNLARYLRFGGLLVADNCGGPPQEAFDGSFRAALASLLPRQRLRPIGADHTLYRSFYLLDRPFGRVLHQSFLEGIEDEGRLQVVYSQNDLLGAWARDPLGNWLFSVQPGGEQQREMAIRLGVNLVMYSMCLDYKKDQVHVETLLRRRRWRPEAEEP